jgi:hypothetical protein
MPNPLGNPVSAALDTTGHPIQRRLDVVLRLIQRVHRTGAVTLPRIPVRQELQPQRRQSGFARTKTTPSRPLYISVWDRSSHAELGFLHEVGHHIERFGIPGHNDGNRPYATDPTIADWLATVRASRAFAELQLLTGLLVVRRPDTYGVIQTYRVDRTYVGYLLRASELWARSYAQYIATRTRDRRLRRQVDLFRDFRRQPVYNAMQREDADFAPIAAATDQLFRSIGWCI